MASGLCDTFEILKHQFLGRIVREMDGFVRCWSVKVGIGREYIQFSVISATEAQHANYIHGDPVFSNILRTNDDQIVMIDMRGQLGKVITTQGDVHYDLSAAVVFWAVTQIG